MNLAKMLSGSQSSLSSLNALLSTGAVPGDNYTPTKAARVCSESVAEIDLVADVLLLQASTKPTVLEPLSTGGSERDCQERIHGTAKVMIATVANLKQHLRDNYSKGVAEEVRTIAEHVVSITENAAQLAYVVAVQDPMSEPALPGVCDRYSFEMAKFSITIACKKFEKNKHYDIDTQTILNISSVIADGLTVIRDGCKRASEVQDLKPKDREMFLNCNKAIQGATTPFLSSLKTFTKAREESERQRCLIFSRTMVESVKAAVDFSQLLEFRGQLASLSEEARESQTAILGSAMAVVSSVVQLFEATKTLLEQPRFMNESIWHRWYSCSKSVTDSSLLLQKAIRTQPLLPSNRSSFTS